MIRVSASSIKELTSCSLSFYYGRVLKMPQRVWKRTIMGSLVHAIFESLRNPRHRHHYDAIIAPTPKVDYTLSPAVARLVRRWTERHSIDDELLADLNGMLYVGLILIDFHFTSAVKVFPPEYEFNLVFDGDIQVRGFIDQLADMGDHMVIRDYKSAKSRFTAKELPENIQARVYQMAVMEAFGKPARVEFVMLRHPPGPRSPTKHLQIVEPSTKAQLDGLKVYMADIGRQMNGFTFEDAMVTVCSDIGWCRNVCSYYAPSEYLKVVLRDDPTQAPIRTYPLDGRPHDQYPVGPDEVLIKVSHPGCQAKWSS